MSAVQSEPAASWLAQVMELRPPWSLQRARVSHDGRALELLVSRAQPAGERRAQPVEGQRLSWRHLDFGGRPSHVYAVIDDPKDEALLAEQPWAAPSGQHFSRAMASHLAELMAGGAHLGALCELYGVTLDTLWRFKYAVDHQQAALLPEAAERLRVRQAARRANVAHAITPPQPVAAPASPLPADDAPVWESLASGRVALDTDLLPLKLLLARLSSELPTLPDAAARRTASAKLHRFFANNLHLLAGEIDQMKKAAP